MEFQQLFLYIPGIIIFLVGTGGIRNARIRGKLGACRTAYVKSCSHVVKKDNYGRDVYNYYNVLVEWFGEKSDHPATASVKSPTEYAEGQQVRLYPGGRGEQASILPDEEEAVIGPWPMAIGGALLILLAMYTNSGKEIPAMACLGVVVLGAGILMLMYCRNFAKRTLVPITAEVTELYSRQLTKEGRIIKTSKYTYYPIVTFELDGRKNIRRCNINSSGEKTFKVGDTMELFYEPATHRVMERRANKGILIAGVILTGLGLVIVGITLAAFIGAVG